MYSYDLSSQIAVSAGNDEAKATSLTQSGVVEKTSSATIVEATNDKPLECSFCGTTQSSGYMANKPPSPKFNNFIDQKNADNLACGNCNVLTSSGSKYLLKTKVSVATDEGFFSIAKDAEAYYFWHNPIKTPFVATRYTVKQAHIYWRSKPSFSNDAFTLNFDGAEYFIDKENVNSVADAVQRLKGDTFNHLINASQSLSLNAMKLTDTRLKLIQKNSGTILGGNYQAVRELKESAMGQIPDWLSQCLTAISDSECSEELAQANTEIINRLEILQSVLATLNNGEVWWVYLISKMRALEEVGKLEKEMAGITYSSMKIKTD